MKHLFVINPAAGKVNRTDFIRTAVNDACRARGLEYEIAVSTRPGDCTSIVRHAARAGDDMRIYACGGDGTLNEVVNGAVGCEKLSVTHFPCGSGNDFVRIFSEPTAFFDFVRLLNAEETCLDLIRCNDRYYGLNICSMGIDARIGMEMAKYKHIPFMTGNGAYELSIAVNLVKGLHRHYVIEIDGQTIDLRQTLICVCNGRYYGSGYHPVPEAEPDDGILDVLVVKAISRLQAARVIGTYKRGQYRELPELITHYCVRSLTVHCDEPSDINVDGESYLEKDVTFSVVPGKLRFFYPKGLFYRNKTHE